MRNFLITVLVLAVIGWIWVKFHAYYKRSHVMSNEIVFEMYTDMTEEEVEGFFQMEKDSFNKDEHELICRFNVGSTGFGSPTQHVQSYSGNAFCEQEYDPAKHMKYEIVEGGWNTATLFVISNKRGIPVALFNENISTSRDGIIASRVVKLPCKKANINRLLVTKYGISNLCAN